MKQPEWQRGGICGALSSTSQQPNLEPSEERERECCITLAVNKFHSHLFTFTVSLSFQKLIMSDLQGLCQICTSEMVR